MPLKAGVHIGTETRFKGTFSRCPLCLRTTFLGPKKGMGFLKIKLVVYSLWQNKTLLFSFEMNTNLIEVGHFP
jgi:hypothetical protein